MQKNSYSLICLLNPHEKSKKSFQKTEQVFKNCSEGIIFSLIHFHNNGFYQTGTSHNETRYQGIRLCSKSKPDVRQKSQQINQHLYSRLRLKNVVRNMTLLTTYVQKNEYALSVHFDMKLNAEAKLRFANTSAKRLLYKVK